MQIPILNGARFYVYEHLRMDTGMPFYVGKGQGRRARVTNRHHRSEFWHRIVEKSGGFEIRFVVRDVDEELAFFAECERIDQLRRLGVRLCNLTDGGDGTAGLVRTEEWRAKIGAAHRGKVLSQETREKISKAVKASGYIHSDEARLRISQAHKGHSRNIGRVQSQEERSKRSESLKGNPSRTGQVRSAEERAKASASLSGRVQGRLTCPCCGKIGGNAMRRWHFDNCTAKK